jgi:hypothetical protein
MKSYSRVVQRLVKAGVDVDLTSSDGTTPLSLACKVGDLATMDALLEANPEPNDGTLHDAARNLDSNAIKLLVSHGHDPNRPSPRHNGRSPLAELCYQAPSFAQCSSGGEMKKAIKALIKGGARIDIKTVTNDDFERSLLLLALDRQKPHTMAEAFLDCDQWKHINDEFNLYTNGEYTFSPIMYVKKGIWKGAEQHRQNVLNLLKLYQARPQFWKNEGEQPHDMIGAPDHIVQAQNERKAEIEASKRRQDELAVVLKLEQDRHNAELTVMKER